MFSIIHNSNLSTSFNDANWECQNEMKMKVENQNHFVENLMNQNVAICLERMSMRICVRACDNLSHLILAHHSHKNPKKSFVHILFIIYTTFWEDEPRQKKIHRLFEAENCCGGWNLESSSRFDWKHEK